MTDTNSVFISYSSKDDRFVNQLVNVIKELGISYWKAPEMIPAGSSYAREIPRAIRECEVFLLVLSKSSQTSIWVEKEIDSAINNRKTIVPVKIDEVPLCELFRFYLNNVQTISYKDDSRQGFAGLKTQMKKLLQIEETKDNELLEVEDFPVTKQRNLKKQNRERSERSADVFEINKAPKKCQYCGGELEKIAVGIFRCVRCQKENYDYLRTVRNYLEKEGARSAAVIERDTGVPRNVVAYFLRQEFLEIPKLAPERLSCQKCGSPIRTGYLCDRCKNPVKRITDKNLRGRWHTGKTS